MLIALIPLVVAVIGAGYFCFATEEDLKWKLAVAVPVLVSIALQFVPPLQTHFLVPLLIQVAVAICVLIYFKANY